MANPLNRYLLHAPMLPQFKRDADDEVMEGKWTAPPLKRSM